MGSFGVKITLAILSLIALLVSTCGTVFSRPQSGTQAFSIYDNMVYKGKPDTAQAGLIACNILYD